MRILLLGLTAVSLATAQAPPPESWLGNLAPIARAIHQDRGFPMAFEHRGELSVDEWRRRGRAELHRTLSYFPKPAALDVKVRSVEQRDGYEVRKISFAASAHFRVPAYLLVPTGGEGPYPGVVALHDHGGYFVHGKEKLVRMPDEHQALTRFRDRSYGGRPFAEVLARRGFVVIVPDAFFWGELRLQHKNPPKALTDSLQGINPEAVEHVARVNGFLRAQTAVLHTWLSFAGTTWMGLVTQGDLRSVDVLESLPEVDAGRLGCVGLSGGGYRSTYLTGLDSRLKASVIVGWMTTLPTTLDLPYTSHSALFDAFGVHAHLDHPDIASLGAPDIAVMVQNCGQDRLFTGAGMASAAAKIRSVYSALGQEERFSDRLYDVPHQFNAEMQDDAFDWLERWLASPSQ